MDLPRLPVVTVSIPMDTLPARFTSGERLKFAPPPVMVKLVDPLVLFRSLVPLSVTATSKPELETVASKPSVVAWIPLMRTIAFRPSSLRSDTAAPPVSTLNMKSSPSGPSSSFTRTKAFVPNSSDRNSTLEVVAAF